MSLVVREQCPRCAENGRDRRGNNLNVFDNGSKHCYSCSYHIAADGGVSTKIQLPEHRLIPNTGIKTRGITKEICDKYNVVNAVDFDNTEKTDNGWEYARTSKICYPYYDVESNELVGYKQINYGVKKDEPGRFLWFGDSSKMTVYGVNTLNTYARNVVICEGENDTLAAAQSLGRDYNVVGISGTGMTERIKRILSTLRKYNKIFVCMDNDEAGRKATAELVNVLPAGKTFVVNLPIEFNDVNDLILAGKKDAFVSSIRDAKQILPKGITGSAELKDRVVNYLNKRDELKGVSSGIPALDYATGGIVPGKLITFAGGTGCGKSTIAEGIAVDAALAGHHSFVLSLEMPDAQVASRMVQTILRRGIASDPDFDISSVNPAELDAAVDIVVNHVHFYEHVGGLSVDTIIDVMNYACDVYDVKLIVLDNYTSASESLEWKDLELLAKRVKNEVALARKTCVIAISHISRDGNNEEEIPTLKHLRGGNGVAQQSDVVIGIGRKRDSKVIECRTIKTDRMTGRFIEFKLEYDNYKLVQVGWEESPTITPLDPLDNIFKEEEILKPNAASEDEQTGEIQHPDSDDTGRKNDNISVGLRDESPRVDELELDVRTDDHQLRVEEKVQTGLRAPEWNYHRSEGLIHTRGQTQVKGGQRPVPINRHPFSFSVVSGIHDRATKNKVKRMV